MAHKNQTLQNLNLLNWNSNGIKNQRSLLINFLSRHNVAVACITETHLSNEEPFKIPGYYVYRKDRAARVASGGVAILIKKQLSHHLLEDINLTSLETVGIRMKFNDASSVKIISTYKQPNKKLLELDLSTVFRNNEATLMIGDFNCKNTIWGCRVNNPDGIKLNNFASTHALQILAPNDNTYFPYRRDHQPDILDIVVQKFFTKPINQTVIEELDSDHLPVLISLDNSPEVNKPLPRLINGYVNWDLFQETLDKTLEYSYPLKTTGDIDQMIEKYTTCITNSIKIATIPLKKRYNPLHQTTPANILELIKKKSKLRREWQRTKNPQTKTQLNNLAHRIKRELDELRIRSYQKHIEDLKPSDPGMWKTTRRILHQPQVICPITAENVTYSTDGEKSEIFANHLEKVFSPANTNNNFFHLSALNYNETHAPVVNTEIKPASPGELKSIINSLENKKSPGHDLIPNIVLKHLTKKSLAFLASIFNACLRLGYFPNSWKLAHIILFHKPGKDKNKPESYRPISLLTTLSKLFEKVIYTRLLQLVDNQDILPPFQFGFRKNFSTTHQLLRLTEMIERGFETKQYTVVAFLDITQAFDKVWTEGLKFKLSHLQLPGYLTKTIFSFLENRKFAVRINNSLSPVKTIHAGVPQGSILGPILFNIFVHDIPSTVGAVAMFADDTAIITQNPVLDVAINTLQRALYQVTSWIAKWKIQINHSKCEAKIFTLKRINNPKDLLINANVINWRKDAVKYLGLNLDTRLTWSQHINQKLNQCYSRLIQLYPIMNRKSHLRIDCSLLLYKSLLRPLATYACPVWGNTSKTNFRKLQTFQNKILRIIVNAPWYIRNQQLHEELKIPTVEAHIQALTRNFFKNINKCRSTAVYDIGQKNIHTRLKRKLPQDVADNE